MKFKAASTSSGSKDEHHQSRELRQSLNAKDYRLALDLRRGEVGGQNWIVARTLLERVSERTRESSDDVSRRIEFLCERNLGDMLRMEGNTGEALKRLVHAAELDSRDVVLWEEIGRLACSENKIRLARHAFQEGLRRSPNHWGCLSQLATVQIVLNRKDEASNTISRMKKLRPPTSLNSLALLRKRRVVHVETMRTKRRRHEIDTESNVLSLSEYTSNALGSLLLSALRSSDENRSMWVRVVSSSLNSNISNEVDVNDDDDNDNLLENVSTQMLTPSVRKQLLDIYIQQLYQERNLGLKSREISEALSSSSSSLQIHGHSVQELMGNALLGRIVSVYSPNTAGTSSLWEEAIVFRFDRKTQSHLIITSEETKFMTLDASNYQKLWRFASDLPLGKEEEEEEEEAEDDDKDKDDDSDSSEGKKRRRTSRRTETLRLRESVEQFKLDPNKEIEILFSSCLSKTSSSLSLHPTVASLSTFSNTMVSSSVAALTSSSTTNVIVNTTSKTSNDVLRFVKQYLSSPKPLRTIVSLYLDWIYDNLPLKKKFGREYNCSTGFERPYKELTDCFECSGYKKQVVSSSSSSSSLPVRGLLDMASLLFDRNINLNIQHGTSLSLASLCCSSSSQIHVAMSWRLLRSVPDDASHTTAKVYLLRGRLHERAGHLNDSLRALELALESSTSPYLRLDIQSKIQEIKITHTIQQVKTYTSTFQDTNRSKTEREHAARETIDLVLKTFKSPLKDHSYLYKIFQKDVSMLTSLSNAFVHLKIESLETTKKQENDITTFISESVILVLGLCDIKSSKSFLRQAVPSLCRVVKRGTNVLHRALVAISSYIVNKCNETEEIKFIINTLAEICHSTQNSLLDIFVPPLIISLTSLFSSSSSSSSSLSSSSSSSSSEVIVSSWCKLKECLLMTIFGREIKTSNENMIQITQNFVARICVALLPQHKTFRKVMTCMVYAFAQMCLSRATISSNKNQVSVCLVTTNAMLELIEHFEFFKDLAFQDTLVKMNREITRLVLGWIESREIIFESSKTLKQISSLIVSKCFEHQYGMRLHDKTTTAVYLLESSATKAVRKIHPDDVKIMTKIIRDQFESTSSKYLQVGLELVLNHVGMPSRTRLDAGIAQICLRQGVPEDFFASDGDEKDDGDTFFHNIYFEYLSVQPSVAFQVKEKQQIQDAVLEHWKAVRENLQLCMADLYYHKMRVETWYYLGCLLYDVFFVWCDHWNLVLKKSNNNKEEDNEEEKEDSILRFGDIHSSYQYAQRCLKICIDIVKRSNVDMSKDVDLRQCYERIALLSMYHETKLSSILSLVSQDNDHSSVVPQQNNNVVNINKVSITTISNFKNALKIAASKSDEEDMSIVHLRIILSGLLDDTRERLEMLKKAVEMSQGHQEYFADALCALHTFRARIVLEQLQTRNTQTEQILCVLEEDGKDFSSSLSWNSRKYNILIDCINTFQKILKVNQYHHQTTYELARALEEGEAIAEAHKRDVTTVWLCVFPHGVGYRSKHGDLTSKIRTVSGPKLNTRVVAVERRGNWIRVANNNSQEERWLPLSHENFGYLFVPAEDVYDNQKRFGTQNAKTIMESLFSKKLNQIVAVWVKRVAKTSLELLHQRKTYFDDTRTKYMNYFTKLCTNVRDPEMMEKLCDRIRSSKTLSETLKHNWTWKLMNAIYKIFLQDIKVFKQNMSEQQHTVFNDVSTTYSTLLCRAYKYHIMSEVLPVEMRRRTENIMIQLYTNCTNTHLKKDRVVNELLALMLPPSWNIIREKSDEMNRLLNQTVLVTNAEYITMYSSQLEPILKSISDTFRPSNCITMRVELDLMVQSGRTNPLIAWRALSYCVHVLKSSRARLEKLVGEEDGGMGPLLPWNAVLESVRRFQFRFVLNSCERTWPHLLRHGVLKKKKKKKRKRKSASTTKKK